MSRSKKMSGFAAAQLLPLQSVPKKALLSLTICAAFAISAFAAPQTKTDSKSDIQRDAKSIMAGVYDQDKSHDASLKATLDLTDKDGHTTRKKFTLQRVGTFGDGKTLVRFTDPAELRGVTLLSINKPGLTDRQWIYIPATERVRSVAPRERSERFAGSDFTFEDIAERSLDDFTYQTLPAEDVIENHKTFKVIATPTSPDRSQYKFIYFWVAQDIPCILHAEMYDEQGRKVREMHASGLRKVSNMWGARKTEMSSLLEGTKTVLTFDEVHLNTGLDESQFTPDALEKTPAKQ